jgi:hypothetical protein
MAIDVATAVARRAAVRRNLAGFFPAAIIRVSRIMAGLRHQVYGTMERRISG